MTAAEFWLPVGAVALYLYDSALLLWQNELVFQHTSRGWKVLGGLELRLSGRRVFLPHPLLPQRPQFQVCWSKGDTADRGTELPADLLRALRPIGWINMLQVLLLIGLPVVLWGFGTGFIALGIFGLFYLASFLALGFAWRRRQRLALGSGNFWLLVLDSLACAPFAANLTRKLAMRHGLAGDPLRFAARHFDDAALAQTRRLVEARVREEYADPDAVSRGAEVLHLVLPRLAR